MMLRSPARAVLLAALVFPASLPAQARISWTPALPVQGGLVTIMVDLAVASESGAPVAQIAQIAATMAGEPLHFEPEASSRAGLVAIAAVPLEARDSVVVELTVGDEAIRRAIPLTPRRARRERLRTAPQFVRPPDSVAARIVAERELVQHVLAETHAHRRLWSGAWTAPRPGAVRSEFGMEREFNGEIESRHRGADLPGQQGAPVRATNRGVVALVGDLYYSGTSVLIDHGAGLVTGYYHLSRALVAVGDTVARGQLIGRVGATGRVTGPHLHWAAHYGRIAFDPFDLLSLVTAWPAAP